MLEHSQKNINKIEPLLTSTFQFDVKRNITWHANAAKRWAKLYLVRMTLAYDCLCLLTVI